MLLLLAPLLWAAAASADDPYGDYDVLGDDYGDWGLGGDDDGAALGLFGLRSDVPVPFSVAVGLAGLGESLLGADGAVDAAQLGRMLQHQLPVHTPACLDARAPGAGNVSFDLSFGAYHLDDALLERFEAALQRGMARSPDSDEDLLIFDVDMAAVEPALDELAAAVRAREREESPALFVRENASPAVLVVSPRLSHVRPPAAGAMPFVYRYVDAAAREEGAYVQSWVARGDYVVADITAGPVEYGGMEEDEGTLSGVNFPRVVLPSRPAPEEEDEEPEPGEDPDEDDDWLLYDPDAVLVADSTLNVFHAKLATLVISAVQRVMLPDFAVYALPAAERVLVPVIAFRDHAEFDPLAEELLDLEAVRREVGRLLLPGQELVVVAATHALHEHPRVALAVEEALRSDTLYRREGGRFVPRHVPFVDADALHGALAEAGDFLAAELLEEGAAMVAPLLMLDEGDGGGAGHEGHAHRAEDTRVVPVYVLSSGESVRTFHGGALVHAGHDAVLVLQSSAGALYTPYASDGEPRHANARVMTRRVVAGLARAVAGLAGPAERLHGRGADFVWSHGHQPFGPFATRHELSELLVAAAHRNMFVSRLSAALHLARDALDELDAFASHHIVSVFRESVRHDSPAAGRGALLDQASGTALATHERLLQDLAAVEQLLSDAADEVAYGYEAARASEASAAALLAARALGVHVREALAAAERAMECCEVEHRAAPAEVRVVSVSLVGIIAVLVFLMALLVVLPMRERTRQKQ